MVIDATIASPLLRPASQTKHVHNGIQAYPRKLSTVVNILIICDAWCRGIETIETHIRSSQWMPTAKIKIETTKDDAKDKHDKIQTHLDATTLTIYTDDSDIDSKIGAASYNSATNEVNHQHLGREVQFNVYTTELTALHLAVQQ